LILQNLLVLLTMNLNQHLWLLTIVENTTFFSNPYCIFETSECFIYTIFALQNILKSLKILSFEHEIELKKKIKLVCRGSRTHNPNFKNVEWTWPSTLKTSSQHTNNEHTWPFLAVQTMQRQINMSEDQRKFKSHHMGLRNKNQTQTGFETVA